MPATVDRLLRHARLCQTSGESIRLAQALTGKGVKALAEPGPGPERWPPLGRSGSQHRAGSVTVTGHISMALDTCQHKKADFLRLKKPIRCGNHQHRSRPALQGRATEDKWECASVGNLTERCHVLDPRPPGPPRPAYTCACRPTTPGPASLSPPSPTWKRPDQHKPTPATLKGPPPGPRNPAARPLTRANQPHPSAGYDPKSLNGGQFVRLVPCSYIGCGPLRSTRVNGDHSYG